MNCKSELVAFDLCGALFKFGVMHHPYRKILKEAKENGRKRREDDARVIMTMNDDPNSIFEKMEVFPMREGLTKFHLEVQEELDGLKLFEDVVPLLLTLKHAGIQSAICSNLAAPYGAVIDKLLLGYEFLKSLSFEVGAIKPDSEIYQDLVNKSGIGPSKVLFIGDTYLADVKGPSNFGFRAIHLQRDGIVSRSAIRTLTDLSLT